MMPDGYDDGPWPPVAADLKGEPAAKVELGGFASAGGSARVNALGLALLADSRDWMGSLSPQFHAVPVEAMAFSCAAVSPWRTPAELVTAVRMHLWIFAFDDHIERSDLVGIDDMLQRCADVVRGKARDDSHWLLTALSDLQADLASCPIYPALADLWVEKLESMLRSMRYEWVAGRTQQRGSVEEYIAHADSVAIWITHLPRWISYGDNAVVDNLDVLVPALGEYVVASRLANDLATYSRERDQPGNDNVLMYGVSPDWVVSEVARRADAAAQLLKNLVAERVLPAVELRRELEYAMTFYSLAEFRGWGSDG